MRLSASGVLAASPGAHKHGTRLVGHRAGGVHIVGDDEEGRIGALVEIDDELVEVRGTDRIEP